MRFAFFGDVVGKSGRDGLADHLPALRRQLDLEFVIVNAENAAAGFGITENTARELFEAGADCLTLGAICAAEIISHYGARPEADLQELVAARLG